MQAGIFEIGVEAGISVEVAVAAKVAADVAAVEEEAVVAAAHGASAVVADLHRIEQPVIYTKTLFQYSSMCDKEPVGSVEHGREK